MTPNPIHVILRTLRTILLGGYVFYFSLLIFYLISNSERSFLTLEAVYKILIIIPLKIPLIIVEAIFSNIYTFTCATITIAIVAFIFHFTHKYKKFNKVLWQHKRNYLFLNFGLILLTAAAMLLTLLIFNIY